MEKLGFFGKDITHLKKFGDQFFIPFLITDKVLESSPAKVDNFQNNGGKPLSDYSQTEIKI